MPRAAPILSSFNAGELSYSIEGRPDIAKFPNGCKVLENYIPMIQGPAKRRGGTRFVAEVKDSSARTWLVRFEFNVQQAYQIEFGNLYIRFYTLHGQLISGGVPYEIASPYTTADLTNSDGSFALRFTESNDIIYITHQNYEPRKLSRISAVNWQLTTLTTTNGPFKDINATSTTVTCSAIVGAVTVTASSAIFTASMVGSLFYVQQPLTSTTVQWEPGKAVALNDLRRSNGVNYKATNAGTTGSVKPIHYEGTVSDGAVSWQYQDPGYGYGTITGFTSTTVVTVTVVNQLPAQATSASTKWAFGAFSAVDGYPSQVTFYKERLVFARGQGVWMSVSGDYENFSSRDPNGNVVTDMAISLVLQSDKVNNIEWLIATDSLLCGTAGGEFAVQSITTNLPFGPDNVTAPSIAPFGSRGIQPVRVSDAVIFVQRSGTKLRDIVYDYVPNKFDSKDNSILADHIAIGGITQMAFQQEPYSIIWCVRADGQLIAMTYSREQYQDAPYGGWHRHIIGGSFGSGHAVVECISVTPAPNEDRDELWMIVKRTINGVTKRYVEYMDYERQYNDDPYDSFYVDCGAVLDNSAYNIVIAGGGSVPTATANALTPGAGSTTYGASVVMTSVSAIFNAVTSIGKEIHYTYSTLDPEDQRTLIWHTSKAIINSYNSTTSVNCTIAVPFPSLSVIASTDWRITVSAISGLGYLAGQEVAILGDGAVVPRQIVSGGAISITPSCGKLSIGLPFSSRIKTMRVNAGAADGTSQGKTSRINKLAVRFFETIGISYGSNFSNLKEIDFRAVNNLMDNAPPLFTGDEVLDFAADYSTDPWLCIEQSDPLPSMIICMMPIISTQDRS